MLPSGRFRWPHLRQAPLTLSKLRVHDRRGGALKKGIFLCGKAEGARGCRRGRGGGQVGVHAWGSRRGTLSPRGQPLTLFH